MQTSWGGAVRAWRSVSAEDFGKGTREYVRGDASIVWQLEPGLVGLAGCYASAGDVRMGFTAIDNAVRHVGKDLSIVSDVRRVRLDMPSPEIAVAMARDFAPRIEALSRRLRKQAGLVADDWTRPFWTGMNRTFPVPWAWEIFTEKAALWTWLGTSREDAAEIDAVVSGVLDESHVCASLETLLERAPDLGAEAAARAVGMSARSLQRELARVGDSFAELRARAREARACSLLATTSMKVEAVATEVGFTSTAHFGTWFRRRRGLTPGAFRETLSKLSG